MTGASHGIGRAVAQALAGEGARVVVNGRNADALAAVVEEIRGAGGEARGCAGDVARDAFAAELVATCDDAFGAVDVLVNCAGIAEPEGSSILDATPEDWQAVLDVHLGGTFHTCRHAAARMVARKRGAIVNTSSHAHLGIYGGTAYPAAKGAVNSLTFAMAADLREHGLRVNAVCPGAKTRLSSGPAYDRHIRDLHRRGLLDDALRDASLDPPEPRFVGPIYAFLASDLAAGITGRLFSAAGGYVGGFARGTETLVGYRDPALGPWEIDELARQVQAHEG